MAESAARGKGAKGLGMSSEMRHRKIIRDNIQGQSLNRSSINSSALTIVQESLSQLFVESPVEEESSGSLD